MVYFNMGQSWPTLARIMSTVSKAELSKLQDNLFETFYKGLSIKKKGFFVIHII